MYSELYPYLKAKYNFDNFEVVMAVLNKQFGDVFNLNLLNNALKDSSSGSYTNFFDRCMSQLNNLYTEEEVLSKLSRLLVDSASKPHEAMLNALVIPTHYGLASQIGYLEKLMTGELTATEPLTYVDMVRSAYWMNSHNSSARYTVAHVSWLSSLTKNTNVLLVNFSKDPKGMPKWGVVDLRNSAHPRVYCEAPLLEGEKLALETGLGVSFAPDVYEGGTAAFSVSTGLTALAWANEYVTRTCALTLDSDFSALIEEFVFIQRQRGTLTYSSEEKYYSASYKAFQRTGSDLYSLARATILGEIEGHHFQANDLCAALDIVNQNHIVIGSNLGTHPQIDINARSFVLGLDAALLDLKFLIESSDSVTLTIPSVIHYERLKMAYSAHASKYVVTASWLENVKRNKYGDVQQEDMATSMVLSVFRGRAKKKKLTIDMPNIFHLNAQEESLILHFMQANPYVTELIINDNRSLQRIKERLVSTFARNRWLSENGYRPPMADNYWKQAAKYWLIQLEERGDILVNKEEHQVFKRCVYEMGVEGLKAVLTFLNDETERDLIERVYLNHEPAFYLACPLLQTQEYLTTLLKHLKQPECYFPFSELGFSYQAGNDALLVDLLGELNSLERFEQIVVTDLLQDKGACASFLKVLARRCQELKWTGLIVIPELADIENCTEDLRELQLLYTHINNVILRNRHEQAASKMLQKIKEVSDFNLDGTALGESQEATDSAQEEEDQEALDLDLLFGTVDADASWPVKRGGAVQLQLQQQQQIEQSRQIQQEQQRVHVHTVEESLLGELVDYKNINKLLGSFYDSYAKEHTIYESAALLKKEGETALQSFFHTWINANPEVNARYVIRKMTQDAAKALLRHHRLLPSGLNPDNLPKGFYTQRTKDGDLILCYNAELAYINAPTPLTLNLNVPQLTCNAWEGDFRQFNLDRFQTSSPELEPNDWLDIILFAKMQPIEDHRSDVEEFCKKNSAVAKNLGLNPSLLFSTHTEKRKKIADNWHTFIQIWQYAGERGVAQFLNKKDDLLNPSLTELKKRLVRNQSQALQGWIDTLEMNEQSLRALSQVFYRYGDQGLTLLLTKLMQIEKSLGKEFFLIFNHTVLNSSLNFNSLMNESFFTAMDTMIATLHPTAAKGSLLVWQAILALHTKAVGWDKVETLWKGFAYFLAEIEQLGLTLEGTEFNSVPPENMLVCMDRVLASLKHIPDAELQQQFIQRLGSIDRTHGGVPYALQYEKFKYFDSSLRLYDFNEGNPTYATNLKELFSWNAADAEIKMRRTLASQSRFSHLAFPILSARLANADLTSKNLLMWLLHTQYPMEDINAIISAIETVNPDQLELIARHVHKAVYEKANQHIVIQLNALMDFIKFCNSNTLSLTTLLNKYPHGTVLEAMSLLHQSGRWNVPSFNALHTLLQHTYYFKTDYPAFLSRDVFKLAALFGIQHTSLIQEFFDQTNHSLPIVQNELRLLITQLLSVDFDISNIASSESTELWTMFLKTIQKMNDSPVETAAYRIEFIEELTRKGWVFKYSKNGDFRGLTTKEADGPEGLSFFIDHEDRLWRFMQAHIVVPVQGEVNDALQPIIRFLKRLQLNRTYLNEIEPLLSSLEETVTSHYWSASYFYGLLRALQPEDDQVAFPISLLKIILQEPAIAAKPIDSVEKDFPRELVSPLQTIIKNTVFNRKQQTLLAQIALREFNWQSNVALLTEIMTHLSLDQYKESRSYALDILASSKNYPELESRFNNCMWLLQRSSSHPEVTAHWTKTAAIWLKAISNRSEVAQLFLETQKLTSLGEERKTLIFHIIAWSTIHPGLKHSEDHEYELDRKSAKLAQRLSTMSEEELRLLAKCYPQQPSPGAQDILHLIKKRDQGVTWEQCLSEFLTHPFPEPRADYGSIAHTRETDLRRMLKATQISTGEERSGISAKNAAQITLIFSYLKNLENGSILVNGSSKPISHMSQQELAEAFMRLSQESLSHPNNDFIRAQIWALLFQALGQTTRKYPHLAQQFALIANDVCIDTSSRVLQLATGEGKSHFVAMRAARHAACGKIVDICTAKRTLAERDLEDYQSLFSYLGFKTTYIHPKSSRDEYTTANIHYTTAGDLSLFLDEQSYLGNPISINQDRRVGLFDEFDFVRFEEGRKTEYNYARPTGKTPKQMTWFYQAINDFYTAHKTRIVETEGMHINKQLLIDLATALQNASADNDERIAQVKQILRDPLQLVQWLQSAHEAHDLQWGVGFTVHEENIEVGDESYPMREIIPLSSDNQKMHGSTFSSGVHQLLAVRLNTLARLKGEPQNFHVHPESHIISSQVAAQRMKELWGSWEGFSGTISAAQAKGLHTSHGTAVLHVPTNQRDLRFWHKPKFYTHTEERLEDLVKQIRLCLAQKKSILFSCKNDKQVQALQELLTTKLSQDELAQFIFYTNEEHRTASEVLEDKRKAEDWRGGSKQKGIGLVASGFGRGDNVGVEAVFLFNVNDTNDLLQKGGRTARNGEEGEVFQFYLSEELDAEEKVFLTLLEAAKVDMGALRAKLQEVGGESPEERCFERVMLLREYVFSLENQPNQAYHNVIAQYSSWGMKLLGVLADPTQRALLNVAFSYQLKHLAKAWIDISSKEATSTADKIRAIEAAVEQSAESFAQRYNLELGVQAKKFQLVRQEAESVELVVSKIPTPSAKDKAVASICSTLMHCLNLSKDERIGQFPVMLEALSQHKQRLITFSKESSSYNSLKQLINQLELALEQIENPSHAWEQVSTFDEAPIAYQDLLQEVTIREPFEKAIHGLTPAMQTLVIDTLRVPNLLSLEERVHALVPVLSYLGRFSRSQQALWGAEYINELDALLHENPKRLLIAGLDSSSPMSYGHFNGLMRLAEHYTTEETDLKDTFIFFGNAIKDSPEQRVRMLTKWSSWASGMNKEEAFQFLKAFCNCMQSFTEGRDWDLFTSLVQKTERWWNKAEQEHQPFIVQFWKQLADHKEYLPELNDVMKWAFSLPGKTWYQVLPILLALDNKKILQYQDKIQTVWAITNTKKISKKEKIEYFAQSLRCLFDLHEIFPIEEADDWVEAVATFAEDRKNHVLLFMQQHKELLRSYPHIGRWLLQQLQNQALTSEQLDLHCNSLERVINYQKEHPEISMDYLFTGLRRFTDENTLVLTQLHKSLSLQPEHTTKILFDKALSFFGHVPRSVAPLVGSVINDFYNAVNDNNTPNLVIEAPVVKKWFEWNSTEGKVRKQRLIFMQLLYSQSLITQENEEEKPKSAAIYQWNREENESLFQLALNHYIDNTQTLLGGQEPQFNLHKVHDLNVKQQVGLLKMASEMKQIGAMQLFSTKPWDTDKQVDVLNEELHDLLNQYKGSHFKAQSRKEQVSELESRFKRAFLSSKRESRYEMVLQALHSAKLATITSDMEEDRYRWFKMNRGGESRYYNVLNQMQELVLRHWVKDQQAIQRLQAIEHFKESEFNSLVNLFNQRLLEEYPKENDPKSREFGHLLSRFFTSEAKQKKINALFDALNAYLVIPVGIDKTGQLDSLMRILQKQFSILPGNMKTLCNELLTRGAVLNEFHQQERKDKGAETGLS